MPRISFFEKLSAKTGNMQEFLTPARLMPLTRNALICATLLGIAICMDPDGTARALPSLLICGALAGGVIFVVIAADMTIKFLLGKPALHGKLGTRLTAAFALARLVADFLWIAPLI